MHACMHACILHVLFERLIREAALPELLGKTFRSKMFYDKGASANLRLIVAVWAEIRANLENYRPFTEKVRTRLNNLDKRLFSVENGAVFLL